MCGEIFMYLCLYLYLCKHSSTRTRTGLPAHSNLRENRSNIVSVLSGELAWPAECCTLVVLLQNIGSDWCVGWTLWVDWNVLMLPQSFSLLKLYTRETVSTSRIWKIQVCWQTNQQVDTSMQKKNCRKPTRFAQPRPGSHSHGPRNQWRPLTFISFDRRFLISLSNGSQVPHSSTGFPSCPGIVNIRKGFLSSTIHYILSTIHHPLDTIH